MSKDSNSYDLDISNSEAQVCEIPDTTENLPEELRRLRHRLEQEGVRVNDFAGVLDEHGSVVKRYGARMLHRRLFDAAEAGRTQSLERRIALIHRLNDLEGSVLVDALRTRYLTGIAHAQLASSATVVQAAARIFSILRRELADRRDEWSKDAQQRLDRLQNQGIHDQRILAFADEDILEDLQRMRKMCSDLLTEAESSLKAVLQRYGPARQHKG